MPTSTLNDTLPSRSTVRIKELQGASRRLDVVPVDPEHGRYAVQSASEPHQYYDVTLATDGLSGRCTCRWASHGGLNCKHVLAALRVHYAGEGHLSFWRTIDDARRQHRHTVAGENLYATLRRS
jgi:hypothetical protein